MGGPAAEQRSAATQRISLHFAVKCRLHTHTYILLRCLQNRLQPQCNPKTKQRCQRHRLQPRPRRSALLSLSSILILSLPHSLALFIFVHCISWGALSWLLLLPACDCSCSLLFIGALSHSLFLSSFLPHPKGFLFSFPLTVLLLCLGCCCCYLYCTVSAAFSAFYFLLFGCFRLLLLPAAQGVSLFCFVLALFGYFWIATLRGVRTWVSDEWLWVKGGLRVDWYRAFTHRTIVRILCSKSVRQLPGNNFKQFMNGNCRFVFRYLRPRGVTRVQLILGVVTLP